MLEENMSMCKTMTKAAREKAEVWAGSRAKTSSGLIKADLMLNKTGRVVSRKQHSAGMRLHAQGKREGWLAAPFVKGRGHPRNARQVFTNG